MVRIPLHPDQDVSESQLLPGCQEVPYVARSFIEKTRRKWYHALIDPVRRMRCRCLQNMLECCKGERYAEDVCEINRKVIVIPF